MVPPKLHDAPEHADQAAARTRRVALLKIWGPSILLVVAGFVVAYHFVDPAPPREIRLLTGPADGAYHDFGLAYRQELDGVLSVQVASTAGSMENLKALAAGEGDVAFVQGGTASVVRITKEERQIASKAAKTMGLKFAGVDIIRSQKGPLLLEVNSSPGLEGIETATGKDVAGMMINSIEKRLNWKREPGLATVGKAKLAS